MPSFISEQGIWKAAREKYYNPVTGEMEVGPDRAASEFIAQEGGSVGQDALKDPQLLQAARNSGFNDVKTYLEAFAPTEKQIADMKKAQEAVVTHAPEKGKESVDRGTLGGFNDDKTEPLQAMEEKRRGRPRKN